MLMESSRHEDEDCSSLVSSTSGGASSLNSDETVSSCRKINYFNRRDYDRLKASRPLKPKLIEMVNSLSVDYDDRTEQASESHCFRRAMSETTSPLNPEMGGTARSAELSTQHNDSSENRDYRLTSSLPGTLSSLLRFHNGSVPVLPPALGLDSTVVNIGNITLSRQHSEAFSESSFLNKTPDTGQVEVISETLLPLTDQNVTLQTSKQLTLTSAPQNAFLNPPNDKETSTLLNPRLSTSSISNQPTLLNSTSPPSTTLLTNLPPSTSSPPSTTLLTNLSPSTNPLPSTALLTNISPSTGPLPSTTLLTNLPPFTSPLPSTALLTNISPPTSPLPSIALLTNISPSTSPLPSTALLTNNSPSTSPLPSTALLTNISPSTSPLPSTALLTNLSPSTSPLPFSAPTSNYLEQMFFVGHESDHNASTETLFSNNYDGNHHSSSVIRTDGDNDILYSVVNKSSPVRVKRSSKTSFQPINGAEALNHDKEDQESNGVQYFANDNNCSSIKVSEITSTNLPKLSEDIEVSLDVSQMFASPPKWCICGFCSLTDTGQVCCAKDPELVSHFQSNDVCLTRSSLFEEIVLNKCGLRYGDWLGNKVLSKKDNQEYRHLAYNAFVNLVSAQLTKHWSHKTLPSCVVSRIRRAYPSPDAAYSGLVRSI